MATKRKVTAVQPVAEENAIERARITAALDMFEALFPRCGDAILNDESLIMEIADHVGIPVVALCLEASRLLPEALRVTPKRLDGLEREPLVKRIIWERAAGA